MRGRPRVGYGSPESRPVVRLERLDFTRCERPPYAAPGTIEKLPVAGRNQLRELCDVYYAVATASNFSAPVIATPITSQFTLTTGPPLFPSRICATISNI